MATKRSDGRYQEKFTYNGRTYYAYGRNKKELAEALAQKLTELENGTLEHENPLLDNYYKQFTEFRRASVKESTIRCQTMQYETCAAVTVPGCCLRLGDMRIKDIRPSDVRHVQMELVKSGRSAETVNDYMHHLSHVFNAAINDETIDRNPCSCLEQVRRTEPAARETKHRALTVDETARFIEAARGSFYFNLFRMMLNTGMRIGEVTALSASDIDIAAGYIHVTKTISRDETGRYYVSDFPKTDAGRRDIPLNDNVRRILAEQAATCRELFGLRFDGLLFPSLDGKIMREYQANREIKRITEREGIEHFTCHAFRATFATRWIEQRPQDFKILSEVLGHSDVKITLNLYAHVMKDKKADAMNALQISM